jgi:hypothetical protein
VGTVAILFDDDILVEVPAVTSARSMDLNLEVVLTRRTWWRRRRLRLRRGWRRCRSTGRLYAVIDVAMVVDNFLDNRWSDDWLRWGRWRRRLWRRRSWLSWRLRGWRSLSSADDDFLSFVITRWWWWAGRTWTADDPFFLFLTHEYSATARARSRCGTLRLPNADIDLVLMLMPSMRVPIANVDINLLLLDKTSGRSSRTASEPDLLDVSLVVLASGRSLAFGVLTLSRRRANSVFTNVDVDLFPHSRRRSSARSLTLCPVFSEYDLLVHVAAWVRWAAISFALSFTLTDDDFPLDIGRMLGSDGFVAATSSGWSPFFFPVPLPYNQRAGMTLAVVLAQEVRLTAGSLRAAVGQDCGRLPGLAYL